MGEHVDGMSCHEIEMSLQDALVELSNARARNKKLIQERDNVTRGARVRIKALEEALRVCHRVLQNADAVIDPEEYPEVSDEITEILKHCDDEHPCPALAGKGESDG